MRLRPVVLVLALLAAGCDTAEPEPEPPPPEETGVVTSLVTTVNPSGMAPLSALVALQTTEPVTARVTVPGTVPATDVVYRVDGASTALSVPVVGLVPGAVNTVSLELFDAGGALLERRDVEVEPQIPPTALPEIAIDRARSGGPGGGVWFVSYFGHDGTTTPQRPFAFDETGTIRWVLDFSTHPDLNNLFYDDGIDRLANGNLYFGDGATNKVYEVTLLGGVVRTWDMPGYSFHHMAAEMPSGNFLVTVNKSGARTVEDHVIEIDRTTGRIVQEWDLRASLDPSRRAWDTDLADLDVDWFHGNAVAYDPTDDTILVSGRTQGLVKLTRANRVVWILAPHRDWRPDLASRLLTPLDGAGQPITDRAVLEGEAPHPDFEWAWYQHAVEVLPGGEIALFDNGDNRFYRQPGTYSRAVIYEVDAGASTVRQAWEYGRERGLETYSRIVSDVDVAGGAVVFAPGAVDRFGDPRGKIVEVDRASGAVAFEATIRPPQALFGITFHRVERMPLVAE